jgi:hypothetical protein
MDIMYPMVCVSQVSIFINQVSLCLILLAISLLFIGKNIKPKSNIVLAIIFLIITVLSLIFKFYLSFILTSAIITLYFLLTHKLNYSKKILLLSILFLLFSIFTAIFFKTPFAIIICLLALFFFIIIKSNLSKWRFLISLIIIIIAFLFLIEKTVTSDCAPGYINQSTNIKNNLMPSKLVPQYFKARDYRSLIEAIKSNNVFSKIINSDPKKNTIKEDVKNIPIETCSYGSDYYSELKNVKFDDIYQNSKNLQDKVIYNENRNWIIITREVDDTVIKVAIREENKRPVDKTKNEKTIYYNLSASTPCQNNTQNFNSNNKTMNVINGLFDDLKINSNTDRNIKLHKSPKVFME